MQSAAKVPILVSFVVKKHGNLSIDPSEPIRQPANVIAKQQVFFAKRSELPISFFLSLSVSLWFWPAPPVWVESW